MAMSASTANWHWKNKGVTPWASSWFKSELPTVIYTTEDVTIGVSDVSDVEGDVELGMRKSKLITIFDVRIAMAWTATHSNGSTASGRLTIPEVSHEVVIDGLTDYQYEWTLDSKKASDDVPAEPTHKTLYALVKKTLPTKLTAVFNTFPQAIIDTHGKDLAVTPTASGRATPTPASTAAAPTPAHAPAATSSTSAAQPTGSTKSGKVLNTSTVRVDANFMVSAEDLFGFLTDEARIPSWTRAPAQSKPEPGAPFSLFAGGVTGNFLSVEKPSKFVQSWKLRSPSWPSDHEGTLTTKLDQQDDYTKLFLELSGVPKGQEDETEKNLIGYYINGLKSIGLGSQL